MGVWPYSVKGLRDWCVPGREGGLVVSDVGAGGGEMIGLAAALEGLRSELELALEAGQGRQVGFGVPELTVTLETVAQRERGGGGKVRWWVVEGGAEAKATSGMKQTLVLKLTPSLRGEDGASGPLDVAGVQEEPGG
jgi:hypothetical protein